MLNYSSTIFRLCFLLQVLLVVTPLVSAERCHPEDKKALLQIKNDLNNPTALSVWNPATDCCHYNQWKGVTCSAQNHRVFALNLSHIHIHHGPLPIPSSIAALPYLSVIQIMSVSNLIGPIPTSITTLDLNHLQISNISLSGTIPAFLSNLNNLITLELSNCNLSGPIPPSLISRMPNLDGLTLSGNSLNGSIPHSFWSFSNQFLYLDLANNRLSGYIPKSLENQNVAFVFLNDNMFEGDASFLFKSNRSTRIDLSKNKLAFDFGRVESFNDLLIALDLRYNKIYGKIPEAIKSLHVEKFNVSHNNLCSKIPTGGVLSSITDASAYAHNKCLCGTPLLPCSRDS
ncbi:hypothetical protein HN51_038130 [Arachis hypogaea]|uniref:Leucine-rich repeat-containing N-terminal plant-type domain-containing protein n=1 Tax=Arachis hypogaea TaxID=3818 RepID=A0A444ZTG7_ARAHY|nr:polygalacturonase inhibitor 2-like [Arachis hypogaea]QHO03793.1 Polygalacturonase inhibitor [Arachis hypogaea]RYR17382.1 hypothetical protein Ahy_B03g062143 [Arachis hypogaea]